MFLKKTALFMFTAFFFFNFLSAQERKEPGSLSDALSAKNVDIGGYGAISMRFTALGSNGGAISKDSHFAYLIGVKGGITFNRSFTIGAGFQVLTNEIPYNCSSKDLDEYDNCRDIGESKYSELSLGYGGLYLSYLFKVNNYIGIDLGMLAGGGVLKAVSDEEWEEERAVDYSFFVLEPELELFVKITGYLGFGVGIGYRSVSIVSDSCNYEWKDLSGLSLNFDVRLGVL